VPSSAGSVLSTDSVIYHGSNQVDLVNVDQVELLHVDSNVDPEEVVSDGSLPDEPQDVTVLQEQSSPELRNSPRPLRRSDRSRRKPQRYDPDAYVMAQQALHDKVTRQHECLNKCIMAIL
jgi:hypothetical protein